MRPKDSYPDRNTPPYWNADLTLYIHTSLTTSSFSHRTCSGVLLSLCSQTRNLAHSYANHSNTLLRASCQKMSKRSVFKKGGAGSKGRLTIKRKEHHEPTTRSIIHTILMKQSAHMVPHTRARTHTCSQEFRKVSNRKIPINSDEKQKCSGGHRRNGVTTQPWSERGNFFWIHAYIITSMTLGLLFCSTHSLHTTKWSFYMQPRGLVYSN